jgi:chromosome segregation ATPase
MATYERIEQELNEAKVKEQKAENELQAWKGTDGQWLEVLKGRLRGEEGTEAQRAEWKEERDELKAEKKSLEKAKEERLKQVELLQDRLTAPTQPGNDFVTRALGTRVVDK